MSRVIPPNLMSEEEQTAWRRFQRTNPALGSAFFSLSFTLAVAAVRADVWVCVIERGGDIAALIPFQFQGRIQHLLRAAEPVGGEMSDYFGLIAPVGFATDVPTLLRTAQLSAINFRNLPAEQLGFGLTGEQPERGHRIEIGQDVRNYWVNLKQQNESLFRELERRERRITEELGPLALRFDVIDKDRELDHLVVMKRAQYRETGVADALSERWHRQLLRSLAFTRDPECTGVLSTLYAGAHWVASHFGLRCGTTLHYWFPVYNPPLAKFGPGHLLLKHIIDGAAAAGVQAIDRGAGHQPHKSAYVTEHRLYYRGCWHDGSLRAGMYRGLQSIAWRWQAGRGGGRRSTAEDD